MTQALLRRIEAGERPTEAELAQLRARAARGGLDERLALAHALLNAEALAEARPLVERLVRDAGHEARVPLLQARLLGAEERWPELHALLLREERRRPDDPEVQKALAIAELRRGEVRSARRRIEAVRARDPLDDEAKLLQAELDEVELPAEAGRAGALRGPGSGEPAELHGVTGAGAAALRGVVRGEPAELHGVPADIDGRSAPAGPPPPEDELAVVLAEALAPRGVRAIAGEGGLVLRRGRARLRVGLGPLARRLAGAADWRQEALGIASALAARLQGEERPPRARLLAEVRPVLRGPEFALRSVGAARAPGPAGLELYFVLEDPELVRHVPQAWLDDALPLQALQAAALGNLDARPTPPVPIELRPEGLRLAERPTGLWALAAGDGHDGARLLTPSQLRLLTSLSPGPWLVRFPSRELTLLAPESQADAAMALQTARARDEEAIAGLYLLEAGELRSLT